jgi:hypothetical protein
MDRVRLKIERVRLVSPFHLGRSPCQVEFNDCSSFHSLVLPLCMVETLAIMVTPTYSLEQTKETLAF